MENQQHNPSYWCAAYPSKAHSGNAQTVIYFIGYMHHVSLSCYPLTDGSRYFIVVIADNPPDTIKWKITQTLMSGQQIKLPNHVLSELMQRYREEKQAERNSSGEIRLPNSHNR
jgi:hypothetical protein